MPMVETLKAHGFFTDDGLGGMAKDCTDFLPLNKESARVGTG